MVWVISGKSRKVIETQLGSPEMLAAENVYLTQGEAVVAHREACPHPLLLGNSKTLIKTCADCGSTIND